MPILSAMLIRTNSQFWNSTPKVITANAYERSSEARKACIRHHGTVCKGCGFDFEKTYGDLGKDFIHVHHITPLKTIAESYKIEPVTDLVPLCPNCHAMVYIGNESRPLSVDELRQLIEEAKAKLIQFMR